MLVAPDRRISSWYDVDRCRSRLAFTGLGKLFVTPICRVLQLTCVRRPSFFWSFWVEYPGSA